MKTKTRVHLPNPVLAIGLREIQELAVGLYDQNPGIYNTFSEFGIIKEKGNVSKYLQDELNLKLEHANYLVEVHNEIGMSKLN